MLFKHITLLSLVAGALAIPSSNTPAVEIDLTVGDNMRLDANHPAIGYELPFTDDSDGGRSREDEERSISRSKKHFGSVLGITFEHRLAKLPTEGNVARTPWPGDYWPLVRDGINKRWNGPGTDSPAVKYAKAFKLDVKSTIDELSASSGIKSITTGNTCTQDEHCNNDPNTETLCGIHTGDTVGRCIPSWFGLCHAWAPAAIMEAEPECAVTHNGITFGINDVKALLTQVYDKSSVGTVFAANRCNYMKPTQDTMNRYTDYNCRDMTPDLFHLIIGNVVGIKSTSFVADVDAKAPVWNQPIQGYTVKTIAEISTADANKYFGINSNRWEFNEKATKLVFVQTYFRYIVEAFNDNKPFVGTERINDHIATKKYEYILELDEKGDIIGGEWVGKSKTDHIDFAWMPTSVPDDEFEIAGISYGNVKLIHQKSINCGNAPEHPPTSPSTSTPTHPITSPPTNVPVVPPVNTDGPETSCEYYSNIFARIACYLHMKDKKSRSRDHRTPGGGFSCVPGHRDCQ